VLAICMNCAESFSQRTLEISPRVRFVSSQLLPAYISNLHQTAWSLNGRSIVKYLKTVQDARLAEEWRTLLSSRYINLQCIYDEYVHGLAADTLTPTIADVALFPPVHAILTDERADFNVTRETFEKINLMQTLPSIISDWKTRLEDELIKMMQVTLSGPFTKDHLLLATTVFRCDACHINLFYPQVLVHHCVTPRSEWQKVDPTKCLAWNSSGSIKFNRDVHQAAIDIVNILGLDPKVVTTENMASRISVLQCLDCRKTRQGRMTMVWSHAVWPYLTKFLTKIILILLFFWLYRQRLTIARKSTIAALR